MHLYLIRHGQSYVNLADWEGGAIDTGLTPLGQEQAARLARWLAAHVAAEALYSSTMRRAVETAEVVGQAVGLPVQQDDRLREIGNCWPDATSINVESEPPTFADFWASERPFSPIVPEGETWGDFVTRVGRFISEATARHAGEAEAALVICHGGVINAALDIAFNVGPWRRTDVWVHNTGITHCEYAPGAGRQEPWRLHGVNLSYHLLEENGSILGYP